MSTSQKTKRLIQKKFKIRGYQLKADALDEVLAFAEQFPDDTDGEAIDLLLDHLQLESLASSNVGAESVRVVIDVLSGANDAPEEPTTTASSLVFIDAFLVPKYRYYDVRKQFIE